MITIENFEYDVSGTVSPGARVTVINRDTAAHTVTADGRGSFDLEVDGNSRATFTAPERQGDYAFYCEFHPAMTDTLAVG